MLKQVGTTYHFRRTIPEHLREVFGKREIWFSLRTSKKMEAKSRGAYLYAQTSIMFSKAIYMTPEDVQKLLQEQAETYELMLLAQQKNHQVERAELLLERMKDFSRYNSDFDKIQKQVDALLSSFEKNSIRSSIKSDMQKEQIADLKTLIKDISNNRNIVNVEQNEQRKTNSRYLLSNVVAHHLKSKKSSEDTIKNTNKSLTLFISCFGVMDTRDIDGNVAGDFKDALQSLPAVHGKQRTNLSIQEEIDRVVSEDLETFTQQTVKNHMCRDR